MLRVLLSKEEATGLCFSCVLGPNIPHTSLALGGILTWCEAVPLARGPGCTLEMWRWAVQLGFPGLLWTSGSLGLTPQLPDTRGVPEGVRTSRKSLLLGWVLSGELL